MEELEMTQVNKCIGLKKAIERLDDLKSEWWGFIKDRLTIDRDHSTKYGHVDSGCLSSFFFLLFVWFIISIVLMFFVEETEKAKGIAFCVAVAIVGLVFGGFLLVVLVEALLKLVLRVICGECDNKKVNKRR